MRADTPRGHSFYFPLAQSFLHWLLLVLLRICIRITTRPCGGADSGCEGEDFAEIGVHSFRTQEDASILVEALIGGEEVGNLYCSCFGLGMRRWVVDLSLHSVHAFNDRPVAVHRIQQ